VPAGDPVAERPPSPAPPAPEDEQTLDTQVLDRLRSLQGGGGPSLLAELVELFSQDAPAHLAGLKEALARGDHRAAERAAHTLKGSAGNLGAARLAAICHATEAAVSSPGGVAPELVAELEAEFARAIAGLQAAVESENR
jgi:two-component system, sensor histidine kinase and response regulator